MEKRTLNDYSKVFTTGSVDERNQLIERLYLEGKDYFYTDKQSDGFYKVGWNE